MENSILNLIQHAEREIRRDSEDLTRLKSRYPGYDFVLVRDQANEKPTIPGETRAIKQELSSLEKDVLSIIDSDKTLEWTSRTVEAALRSRGLYRLPENDDAAMNAVSGALISLMDAKKIQRIHQGRGRDPHRYISIEENGKEATEVTS
jgi:hypothetical protein